jgi:hypothetical protein
MQDKTISLAGHKKDLMKIMEVKNNSRGYQVKKEGPIFLVKMTLQEESIKEKGRS